MTTITLTQEQEAAIIKTHADKFAKEVATIQAAADRQVAGAKRRADARVIRAKQRTTEWRQRYNTTRSALLKANGEIVVLKRRLRNGDWNQP